MAQSLTWSRTLWEQGGSGDSGGGGGGTDSCSSQFQGSLLVLSHTLFLWSHLVLPQP